MRWPQRQAVYDLYLECRTQQEIADALGISRQTVGERIREIIENGKCSDSDIFPDFDKPAEDGEKSPRQLYSIWNFPKATNEVRPLVDGRN
jgi:hypothetical protein